MKKQQPIVQMSDEEKYQQWLNAHPELKDLSPQEGFAFILYKLYRMEEMLAEIHYNTRTHWAN